jgi:hypothetical protein
MGTRERGLAGYVQEKPRDLPGDGTPTGVHRRGLQHDLLDKFRGRVARCTITWQPIELPMRVASFNPTASIHAERALESPARPGSRAASRSRRSRQIRRVDPVVAGQSLQGGDHVTAGDDQAVHQDHRGRVAIATSPAVR